MSSLTDFDSVIDFAVREEEKANALYTEMVDKVDRGHLKEAFTELAAEEAKHKEYLLRIKGGGEGLKPSADRINDLGIAEMMREVEMDENLDYQHILVFAMKREKAAFKMYTALAEASDDAKMRETFEALAQEEAKHKLRIETEYDETILTEN